VPAPVDAVAVAFRHVQYADSAVQYLVHVPTFFEFEK
jgi:hypothetical protein